MNGKIHSERCFSFFNDICFADDIRFAYKGTDIISYLQSKYIIRRQPYIILRKQYIVEKHIEKPAFMPIFSVCRVRNAVISFRLPLSIFRRYSRDSAHQRRGRPPALCRCRIRICCFAERTPYRSFCRFP